MSMQLVGAALVCGLVAGSAGPAAAHFQEILPTTDRVGPDQPALELLLAFTHPMARGPAMPMARPERVAVATRAGVSELTDRLEPVTVDGAAAWRLGYQPAEPGILQFLVEPAPYWEPAEGKLIRQNAKVIVDAFDWGEGWDRPVGLPVEIVPLVQPFGLWTGNLFSGRVLADGEPLPGAEVEIEWANDGSVDPAGLGTLTQVLKADPNGIFHYALPRAGWWGFAALTLAAEPGKAPDGQLVPVELGGVIWVQARDLR